MFDETPDASAIIRSLPIIDCGDGRATMDAARAWRDGCIATLLNHPRCFRHRRHARSVVHGLPRPRPMQGPRVRERKPITATGQAVSWYIRDGYLRFTLEAMRSEG